ncbi:MAG: IS3 family transposase [Proteobacteria bacterium]|nr:IS3 family transposase [Pseudomonadota bacterium]
MLFTKEFHSAEQFIHELKEYVEYYNNKRIKNRLNGMCPVQ